MIKPMILIKHPLSQVQTVLFTLTKTETSSLSNSVIDTTEPIKLSTHTS